MRVYAGLDALTGERHYLTEVVPAGPKAAAEAERVRTRLLSQVDERRNPKTRATLNQLLDRYMEVLDVYMEVLDVEPTTKRRYELDIRRRLRPVLGRLPLSRIEPDLVERLYAPLRTCRNRCGGKAATSSTGPAESTSATASAGRSRASRCRHRPSGPCTGRMWH
ncbi:MAG TPA: hypothetical protein VFP72_13255 [Kineosporiaceae bacterium]|nr:hypothetical protein [Kineosporiaceae bacterium]